MKTMSVSYDGVVRYRMKSSGTSMVGLIVDHGSRGQSGRVVYRGLLDPVAYHDTWNVWLFQSSHC
jgi:ribosomal protein L35AE/L33A